VGALHTEGIRKDRAECVFYLQLDKALKQALLVFNMVHFELEENINFSDSEGIFSTWDSCSIRSVKRIFNGDT
jgi:hypothetical protein